MTKQNTTKNQRHKCKICGTIFTLYSGEVNFFQKNDIPFPRRCKKCRSAKKEKSKPKKYCHPYCAYLIKDFQGFGGWLGQKCDKCELTENLLQTENGKTIRSDECKFE